MKNQPLTIKLPKDIYAQLEAKNKNPALKESLDRGVKSILAALHNIDSPTKKTVDKGSK